MVKCFVMLKVVPGIERVAYTALKDMDGVEDVYHMFGEYDFFIVIEAGGLRDLQGMIDEIKESCYVAAARIFLAGEPYISGGDSPTGAEAC